MFKYYYLLFFVFILSSCSILNTPEPVDYASLQKTAEFRLTQTFEALPTATSTFTPVPTNTNTPEPTATDVPTPTEDPEDFIITRPDDDKPAVIISPEPTATAYFPDKADFVAALPSPNQFTPNQHFNLTWQLKNAGTSTWSGKYRFYYYDGIQLANQSSYSISETVPPGGILTITMPASAPGEMGTYKTTWVLENPDGIPFYYVNFTTIVGDKTYITEVPGTIQTSTPDSFMWMCSDPERSIIQGDGCTDYCSESTVKQLESNGISCFANGERVVYE